MVKQKIIFASTSSRRKEIATAMGLEFEMIPSGYEEDMSLDLPPEELVKTLSYGKAKDVADKLSEGIVVGIDTIVCIDNKKLGKPKNKEEAFEMLRRLSGKFNYVYSGVCLINCKTGKIIKDFELTKVKFRKISDLEIEKYVATGEPMDKAGAYGIQGLAGIFVEKIDGCYFNVMGLPVHNLYKNLKKMGVDVFDYDGWKGK